MSKRTKKPILNFVIEPELLAAVDEFRYKNKIPKRSEAIRQILRDRLTREGIK